MNQPQSTIGKRKKVINMLVLLVAVISGAIAYFGMQNISPVTIRSMTMSGMMSPCIW
jgi:hypothetical protein